MNTSTTALSLGSVDGAVSVVLPRQGQRALPRAPAARPLQQAARVIAVLAIAPLVLAAFAALIVVLSAKLICAILVTGVER